MKQIKAQKKITKWLLIIAGTISLGLGIIGIFLPILPTTPFLLLSAACYARSSDKFYNMLLSNRFFGTYLKNYREGKGIPLKVKVLSISMLWLTITFSAIFVIKNYWVKGILFLIAISVTIHILLIRTFKKTK